MQSFVVGVAAVTAMSLAGCGTTSTVDPGAAGRGPHPSAKDEENYSSQAVITAYGTPATPAPLATPAGTVTVGGESFVSGDGTVSTTEFSVFFHYQLNSLETTDKCETDPNVENGCGIHIHKIGDGTTICGTQESVGGHYYGVDTDPWVPVRYTTDGTKGTADGTYKLVIGIGDIDTRAFVVHDSAGARAGCGVITASLQREALERLMLAKTAVV